MKFKNFFLKYPSQIFYFSTFSQNKFHFTLTLTWFGTSPLKARNSEQKFSLISSRNSLSFCSNDRSVLSNAVPSSLLRLSFSVAHSISRLISLQVCSIERQCFYFFYFLLIGFVLNDLDQYPCFKVIIIIVFMPLRSFHFLGKNHTHF